jgi:hypothetical protein
MDPSDESDEEPEINNQMNVTNCQQAIDVVKDLQQFVTHRGDSKGMEMLSELELHFQDIVFKTNTRQTTLLDYYNMI